MELNRPSRAKAFFDQINEPDHGAKFLEQLINADDAAYESEYLEFKGGRDITTNGDEFSELWGKNLSCFANSDGGVLIFGIHAPKGQAKSLSLVEDLDALCERLKNQLPKITEPPVQRVEIKPFPISVGSNKGFVVCFIPPSPWRPHQVRVKGGPGHFYIRAADNCIPCNHTTLRALFAPQYVSVMKINYQWILRSQPISHRFKDAFVHFWLENKGPATAKQTFVRYAWDNILPTPSFDARLWEELPTGHKGFALMCKRSIHPGERVSLCEFGIGFVDRQGVPNIPQKQSVCRFSVSAHNQAPMEFDATILASEFGEPSLKKTLPVEVTAEEGNDYWPTTL